MYHITSGICLKYMNTSLNSGIQRNPQVYCHSKEVNGRKNPMLGICTRTLVFTLLRLVNILDWYVSNTGYFVNCSQSIFFLPLQWWMLRIRGSEAAVLTVYKTRGLRAHVWPTGARDWGVLYPNKSPKWGWIIILLLSFGWFLLLQFLGSGIQWSVKFSPILSYLPLMKRLQS